MSVKDEYWRNQDSKDLAKTILNPDTVLDIVFIWIRNNIDPGYLYDEFVLAEWATSNGFIKEVKEKEIK